MEFSDINIIIEALKEGLIINTDNLDIECKEQPMKFAQASETYAQAVSLRDEQEAKVKNLEASLSLTIRATKKGDERITEGKVEAMIESNEARQQEYAILLEAREKASVLFGLVQAYAQRKDMLQDLCRLFIAGYFGNIEVKGGGDVAYQQAKVKSANQRQKEKNV